MDRSLQRHAFDRRLYMAAAIGFASIVIVGFGRTYYARNWFGSPPLRSWVVHVHGLLMTAWVVLFATQVRLIAVRQVRLHQRLGYAGVALGGLIIATGVPTAVSAAKYGSASFPQGISPLSFLLVPLFDLLMFILFFGAAIYYRKQAGAHKRLMLLTAINFLPPALARIPVEPLTALGPLWFFGFPTAIAVLCLTLDGRRHGRVNTVFLSGTILLVCSYVARLGLMTTHAWMNVAAWLTSFA